MATQNTYTVVKGDTLSEIAVKFDTTVSKLVSLNNIKNPDLIIIGQVLRLTDDAPKTTTKSSQNCAVIELFGIQSNTERTMYATWVWNKTSDLENYQVMWYYATGDGVWFVGNDSTTEYTQSIYTPPSNATKVRFKVKPIAKKVKKTVKSGRTKTTTQEVSAWTASWSTAKDYTLPITLTVPPTPTVKIKNYKLTATIENLDVNGNQIEFYVCKDNKTKLTSATVTISTDNYVSYTCNVAAGSEYKVRCRTVKGDLYSEWSDYSSNIGTGPKAPSKIIDLKALSTTEVQLSWNTVDNADTYEIEYTTQKRYFDSSDQTTTKTVDSASSGYAEITGLETGQTYFFRLRACNDGGKSGWTGIKSITIGKKPTAPTTWSSTTTTIVGEELNLYWVHNAEDGSSQTYAQLELTINGTTSTQTIKNSTEEDEKDKTSVYTIDTSSYTEGTVIKWKVRTKGIIDEYSDWSTQRTIDVYAPPVLELEVNNVDGEAIETLTEFPFYVKTTASPNTQTPIGFHISVVANESYETIDQLGNATYITEGDSVYSKYFNSNEDILLELSAGNINLENNINYSVRCTVSMDSGLTADASYDFVVGWSVEDVYEPNAAIIYDPATFSMNINPYCKDEDDTLIEGVLLSVYRMEYDGSFTEIAVDLDNVQNMFVTDPHPSLNYARYRIVAKSGTTGKIGYYDMPGYFIGETSIIVQWDEEWKSLNLTGVDLSSEDSDPIADIPWSGSLLRLPYNVDISDSNQSDVALIEYIGRENPVSYHGTQLGVTATWNAEIDKNDEETIYALRRLARWMGNVYVREPSGLGYWAVIQVSFSKKHKEVTIPVTLNITKVEGGM